MAPSGVTHPFTTMNDCFEILKVNGINLGTVAAVSTLDLELILKIVVLILTAIYTAAKIYKLCKGGKTD